ncbi:MAG: CRISPR-associated DxTHG motif protein [Salinibacter sp.]
MARRLISFLGAGKDYDELLHLRPDTSKEICETDMVQEAIVRGHPEIDEVFVLVTPKAREENWDSLLTVLPGGLETVEALDIPSGFSQDDQWAIFEQLRAASEEREEVLLDITHSFRSIPLIAVAAALYLKEMDGTDVRILYGALQEETVQLVELTPFMRLVEMAFAARSFLRHGDLGPLAENLDALKELEGGESLEDVDVWIARMARALNLLRLPELRRYSLETRRKLMNARLTPPPAEDLLNRIQDEIGDFSEGILGHSLEQLQYYRRRNQWVEALLCSRELVLTLLCDRFGLEPTNWNHRKPIRDALNDQRSEITVAGQTVTLSKNVREWYEEMGKLRNQVAHNSITSELPYHDSPKDFQDTVQKKLKEFSEYVEDYIAGAELQ